MEKYPKDGAQIQRENKDKEVEQGPPGSHVFKNAQRKTIAMLGITKIKNASITNRPIKVMAKKMSSVTNH